MPGRADPALEHLRPRLAHEHRRHVVAELDPAYRRIEHFRVDLEAVPDLREVPFRRVRPARLREILRPVRLGVFSDLLRLSHGRVILPQPREGIDVPVEFLAEGERRPLRIDRYRRRPGGIHADADDPLGREARRGLSLHKRALDAAFEAFEVVGGMLPGDVRVGGIGDDSLIAARVVVHEGGDLFAVGDIDDESAHGVGTEIQADGELAVGHYPSLHSRLNGPHPFPLPRPPPPPLAAPWAFRRGRIRQDARLRVLSNPALAFVCHPERVLCAKDLLLALPHSHRPIARVARDPQVSPLRRGQSRRSVAAWGQGPGPLRGVGQRPTVYLFAFALPFAYPSAFEEAFP